jgi:serine/threonine protein phosphatase PrpC
MRIDVGAAVELDLRDTVLVASDGLMDNVHVDEIIEIARKGPLSDAVQGLVDVANQRMQDSDSEHPSKPDDLSLILFRNTQASGKA